MAKALLVLQRFHYFAQKMVDVRLSASVDEFCSSLSQKRASNRYVLMNVSDKDSNISLSLPRSIVISLTNKLSGGSCF